MANHDQPVEQTTRTSINTLQACLADVLNLLNVFAASNYCGDTHLKRPRVPRKQFLEREKSLDWNRRPLNLATDTVLGLVPFSYQHGKWKPSVKSSFQCAKS